MSNDAIYTLRLAQEEDAEEVAAIYRPFVDDSSVSFEETAPDTEEMSRRIQKAFEKHVWLSL